MDTPLLVAGLGDALARAKRSFAQRTFDPKVDIGAARTQRRVLRIVAEGY